MQIRLTYDKYCKKCGAKNVFYPARDGFLAETGEPAYFIGYKCPNKKLFSIGHASVEVCSTSANLEFVMDEINLLNSQEGT